MQARADGGESLDQPPFTIQSDPARGVVDVVSRGFWTLASLDLFVTEMERAIAACRSRGADLSIKVNALAAQPQSADVNARSVEVWRSWLERPGDRAAIIVKAALATLQFRRLFEDEQCRIFDNEAMADAWLAKPH